jgi:hypothetical protein
MAGIGFLEGLASAVGDDNDNDNDIDIDIDDAIAIFCSG